MRVHPIRIDQRRAAAETLTEAFHDDPLLRILAPDRRRRAAVGRWFFRVSVDYGMRWGEIWVTDDAEAVSIWPPPGSRYSALRSARVGMAAFPFRVGLGPMLDVIRVAPAMDRLHGSVTGPHWHLMTIGTRPSRQGEGLGRALVTVGTKRADAAGLPCYLETATQADYFANHGFEVVGRDDLNGHAFYAMVRPPGTAHPARASSRRRQAWAGMEITTRG